MKSKKSVCLLTLVLVLSFLAAGCGPSGWAEDGDSAASTGTTTTTTTTTTTDTTDDDVYVYDGPVEGETLYHSGTGNMETAPIRLTAGSYTIIFSHTDGPSTVVAVNRTDPTVVRTILAGYTTMAAFTDLENFEEGVYYFTVQSEGDWRIGLRLNG